MCDLCALLWFWESFRADTVDCDEYGNRAHTRDMEEKLSYFKNSVMTRLCEVDMLVSLDAHQVLIKGCGGWGAVVNLTN